MEYIDAFKQAATNKFRRYPGAGDQRSHDLSIFPSHNPKFNINFSSNTKIFTIGSCFARNIEEVLLKLGVNLPTMDFSVPKDEYPHRSNGILNEFNPGTISQRLMYAIEGKEFPHETIARNGELFADLLLHSNTDVSLERALKRRKEVDLVYGHLIKSHVVIVTLGYVETWFDEETKLFLNRMPPRGCAESNPKRFVFKRLDVYECMPLLEEAINRLTGFGVKVIVTVSPVPIRATFTTTDCVVANEFSKAVLRVCAERLVANPNVDYFPSYEIVRSRGLRGYYEDHIHVDKDFVEKITGHMVHLYENEGLPT